MRTIDKISYEQEEGRDTGKKLTVYALSTCGFCKRALSYLRDNNIKFQYAYVDYLQDFQRKEVKKELKEEFGERPLFPFLVIDDTDYLIGFDEDEWQEKLELAGTAGKTAVEEASGNIPEKELKDAWKFARMVSKHQGWKLNGDEQFLRDLIEGLHTNKKRLGYYLCPCRLGSGDKEKDKDIICPCDYARPDIEEYGHCYCSLYLSEEFYESKEKPKSIPERRPEDKRAD
ncbi:MAG: ferredoxin-thioredoxin reductase catalytic domain-containing protein [Spirochaetia bacterium]